MAQVDAEILRRGRRDRAGAGARDWIAPGGVCGRGDRPGRGEAAVLVNPPPR